MAFCIDLSILPVCGNVNLEVDSIRGSRQFTTDWLSVVVKQNQIDTLFCPEWRPRLL